MAPLLSRARALLAAGPFDASPAELAAVHAGVWPTRAAVCQTCRAELGRAYFAIQRWAAQQEAAGAAPLSSPSLMSQSPVARFASDTTVYTPHGLGVAYSNANLTNKVARDILAADPDAAPLFAVLPPAVDGEAGPADNAGQPDAGPADNAGQPDAGQPVGRPDADPATTLPAGFDYGKLARAMVDELERRALEREDERLTRPDSEPDAPTSAADAGPDGTSTDASSADGAGRPSGPDSPDSPSGTDGQPGPDSPSGPDNAGSEAGGAEGERPVRLSRMNREQLVAAYTTELGHAPAADLVNDELREALAKHRASQHPTE